MKRFYLYGFTILALFALLHLYFHSGFPYTHDGENHLARFANYKIALKEGQFPPRFAPNLMNHYGYPVFNFNYPLANILSVPFSLLGISYETTFKLLVILGVIFAAIGVWRLGSIFKAGATTRWLSVIFWLLQPFLISTIYFRGNIGEIMALSLLPWLIWIPLSLLGKTKSHPSLHQSLFAIVVLTAFLLSHNISAVIGGGVYLLLSLVCFYKSRQKLWYSWRLFAWAAMLSLWFWLPALFEMSLTVVGSNSLVSSFSSHFVTLSQLLWSPLRFGYSYPGGVDSLSFAVGWPIILTLFSALLLLLISKTRGKKYDAPMIILLLLAWLSVIGQLQLSKNLWQLLPALKFLQFPWRLSLFTAALLLPSFIFILRFSKLLRMVMPILLFFQVITTLRLSPIDYFHKRNLDYDVFSQSTSTLNENRTKEFTYTQIGDWQPTPVLLDPTAGSIAVKNWNGSNRVYTLDLSKQTTIIEPTMNFAGWQTRQKQQGMNKKVSYIHNQQIAGRIAYSLPAGKYEINSRFTQNTPSRILGNSLSLLTLGALLWRWKKHRDL